MLNKWSRGERGGAALRRQPAQTLEICRLRPSRSAGSDPRDLQAQTLESAGSDPQDLQLLVKGDGDPVGLGLGPLQLVHLRLRVVGEDRVCAPGTHAVKIRGRC
eukprot:282390-Pleurochrysis_carterae.AAC.1